MTYTPLSNTKLYLPFPRPQEITYGFYLPGELKPSEISLAESWSDYKGYYFFLFKGIESGDTEKLEALEKKITEEASLQNPLHTGAFWWMNDADNNISALQSALHTKLVDDTVAVDNNVNLGFGTYQLPLFSEAPLTFDPAGVISSGYPVVAGAQDTSVGNGLSLIVADEQAGILTGQTMISDFSNAEHTGWSAGFRYNMKSSDYLSQYYPLFDNTANTYWVLNIHWDPLHPLDSSRSYMGFTGVSFGLEKTAGTKDQFTIVPSNGNTMSTWLRTIYGQAVSLQPVTSGSDPAQLVFQTYFNTQGASTYYLAPKGSFIMNAVAEQDGTCKLLTGLSGTECIQFTPGDLLVFYPGNAAYATDGTNDNILDSSCTASWAFVTAASSAAVIYSAAPGVASLYEPSTSSLLNSYYAANAQLPPASKNEWSFPLVPYAGIASLQPGGFTSDQIPLFEMQLIVNNRQKQMTKMPPPNIDVLSTGTPITTTTPQGLLAKIDGLLWKEVLLAKNTELPVDFRFTDLPPDLRNAFQSEDLFLVISDNAHIGSFDHGVSIEGWKFNVNVPKRDPNKDPDKKNILILKFRKGAITDIINNTSLWTQPDTFNYNADQVVSIQTWLSDYCNEAIDMATSNSQFVNFASIIQDPEWYGILALRTDIDLGNFPADLKGLLGAMDLSRFYAHHVGVQVNFVEKSTSLDVKKSNLFALINYIDPAYQQSQGGGGSGSSASRRMLTTFAAAQNSLEDVPYVYKVLVLQIVFANSAITNFDSKLELTARKWFEEAGTLNVPGKGSSDDPANYSMIFNGRYENHDGHRTYTFLTQQNLTYQYFLTSKVLHYIEFVKAQFQTISSLPSKTLPDIEDITARFTFYGFLNFEEELNFDCFSYGGEKGQELDKGLGLYFSNLALNVTFALNKKTNTTDKLAIALNPGNVSFDQSLSTMREKSFAASFPISPNSILSGVKDNTPKKLGYLQVGPPTEFSTSGLKPEWYAINFDMHWGGPGALASQAGFLPQLMLAWSPGAESVNVALLIKLPGSGGGNTFSIQNVLKLSAGPFKLNLVEHDGKISYNFFFINLSLSLFGVKLPPMGNTNLVLIGDAEQPGTLGWYGAFINK